MSKAMVMVPREPTREMVMAGIQEAQRGGYGENIYRAMLAAAPAAQPEPQCRVATPQEEAAIDDALGMKALPTIRLPLDAYNRIAAEAESRSVTLSAFVRWLLLTERAAQPAAQPVSAQPLSDQQPAAQPVANDAQLDSMVAKAWNRFEAAMAREQQPAAQPVAYGMPNSAITGSNRWMMLRERVPEDDQYGGALWVPLYTAPQPLSDQQVAAQPVMHVCGACGKPWDGETCGQAGNDWPHPVCYPMDRPAAQPVAQEPAPIALLWQVRRALALACAICDAVPSREPGHLGKLVNAQEDGTHGYREIHDAEAALSAWLTTPEAAAVAAPQPLSDQQVAEVMRLAGVLADTWARWRIAPALPVRVLNAQRKEHDAARAALETYLRGIGR